MIPTIRGTSTNINPDNMQKLTLQSQKYLLDSEVKAVGDNSIIIGNTMILLNEAQCVLINMAVKRERGDDSTADATRGHVAGHIDNKD